MGPHDDDELPYASTCWPGDAAQGDAGARHGFAPGLALWPMLVAGAVLAISPLSDEAQSRRTLERFTRFEPDLDGGWRTARVPAPI